MQATELQFDDAQLPTVLEDKKSRFSEMEIIDSIYHQFLLTADWLGHQPTTSHVIESLALISLALAAAGIHCALSDSASGKKGLVIFSQHGY